MGKRIGITAKAIRGTSGKFRVLLAVTAALSGAGHSVDVIAGEIDATERKRIRQAGGRPRLLLPFANRLARKALGHRAWTRLFTRLVSRRNYDLVIGNGELLRQDVLILHNVLLREAQTHPSSPPHELESISLQETLLRGADFRLLIANSDLMKREIVSLYGVPAAAIEVIHPGFDAGQFSPARRDQKRTSMRRRLGITDGQHAIAFVTSGNLRMRGADILAEAFSRLPPALQRSTRVLTAANQRNQRWLENAFERHGVSGALVQAPRAADVENYYVAADVLAHPARFETFSLIVEEAAACGCPVVAPACVGATELFHGPSREGVIPEPDAALLAARLTMILEDPGRRAALAKAQYDDVRSNTTEAYQKRVLAALRERGLL